MHMFSSDIHIAVGCLIIAADISEAISYLHHPLGMMLSVPEDNFFTDNFFSDPQLQELTFATTFTLYGLIEAEPFYDYGPIKKLRKDETLTSQFDDMHSFSCTALVAATVYIKADNSSDAEKVFRNLNGARFEFKKEGPRGVLGIRETDDLCFVWPFTCSVLPEMKLKDRGPCARYCPVDADPVLN